MKVQRLKSLLFLHRCLYLVPIQHQKDFHRSMSCTLVAVDEGMANCDRYEIRRCHVEQIQQVLTVVGCAGCKDGRLEGGVVSHSRDTTGLLDFTTVDVEDILHSHEERLCHLFP